MRVLVAAPPKTGNVWLERLLSLAFGLHWIREAPTVDYWGAKDVGALCQFLASGRLPKMTICHQHFWPSEELFDVARDWDIALATTLRDPYDQFVSWYWFIQRFAKTFVAARDPGAIAIGKTIDDPEVLALLATHFGRFLDQAAAWLDCGRSLVVRYEDLHKCPTRVLADAGEWLGMDQVLSGEEVIGLARAEAMRQISPDLSLHVRAACVGDWRNHLTERHLDVFRAHHRRRIEQLGYVVH
jgi:hypothetical protein